MGRHESEPKIIVTPIKKAKKYQKKAASEKSSITAKEERFKSFDVILNGREFKIKYDPDTEDIIVDGKKYSSKVTEKEELFEVEIDKEHNYSIEYHDGQIFLEGRLIDFDFTPSIPELKRQKSAVSNKELIIAPLPGHVIDIAVKQGDKVIAGQKILSLEAMKMQNEILCNQSGIVSQIYIQVGDLVKSSDKLVLIKREEN